MRRPIVTASGDDVWFAHHLIALVRKRLANRLHEEAKLMETRSKGQEMRFAALQWRKAAHIVESD